MQDNFDPLHSSIPRVVWSLSGENLQRMKEAPFLLEYSYSASNQDATCMAFLDTGSNCSDPLVLALICR